MKNSQPVTAYLDHCQVMYAGWIAARDGDNELLRDYNARSSAMFEESARLWQAALDAGWTVEELSAAFRRRFEDRENAHE